MKNAFPALTLGALLLTGCSTMSTDTPVPRTSAIPAAAETGATATEDARLNSFLDAAFDAAVALSPEAMTSLGLKTDYDKLDDYTPAADARSLALEEQQLAEMQSMFDPADLGPTARLSYRLFEEKVATDKAQDVYRDYGFPVSTNGSPAGSIPVFLINQHRVANVDDAEAYIARIRETERVMTEVAATMRDQASKDIVPPEMVFTPAREDAKLVITGAPFDDGPDSSLMADFKKKVGELDIADSEKARLIGDAEAAMTGPFMEGFDTLFGALDSIGPLAKGNDGAWSLPNGDAYYAARLKYYTTTDLTADQIHRIGLDQVASIRAEMETLKQEIGFDGTMQQFFTALRTDPAYQYPNDAAGREAYLDDARAAIARAMAAAPQYFEKLPEAPLEVRAVEPFREETAAVAFYNRPAPDGSRPGIFYVNLADMTQVQKPQVEAIAFHEGAPGHHFQIARAQEIPGLPKFRRFGFYGAYGEGWGLYSERLAAEMGGYDSALARFGMLSLQMWRAIRLVTDTGLHSKRWSQQKAIDYFTSNAPLSARDIEKEVNRYINNPGQATSYMIGQLKIAELRARAEQALGPKFDIRAFHEVVLGQGALPLDVLEEQVDGFIAASR